MQLTSKYAATSLCHSLTYFLTASLGLLTPAIGTVVTLLWLPTGIAVAVLYRSGLRHWPAVTFASIVANLVFGQSFFAAVGISIGNTLGPMLAVWLLHRLQFDARFERNRDIAILAAAGHAGMLVSASCGVVVLLLSGLSQHEIITTWLCWWAGDSMGVIAAAPLVLVGNRAAFHSIRRHHREFTIWLILLILLTGSVFVLNRRLMNPALPLAFVPLTLIPWATMRFGTMGTSLAIILISCGAVYGTSGQFGPFYRSSTFEQIFLLWVYMATAATIGWSVAALRLGQIRDTRFQRILEKSLGDVSLGVLMTDRFQNITYVNTGFTRLTGYGERDLLGKNCRILQGKNTDRNVVARVKADLETGGRFEGEILNYRKDGTRFWNAVLITMIHDDSGEHIGFLGIQRDITSKKEAEMALRESESHLRSVLDLEPDCVKIVSPDGRLIQMNAAGLAMIEAESIEQVRGALLEDLIVEDYRVPFRRMHQRVLAGEERRLEFAIRGLKGTPRWLESRCVQHCSADGHVTGVLGVTRDITTRRQVESTMRESRNRLNSILNAISEVVYSASVAGDEIHFISRHAVTLYGRSAAEFVANPKLWFTVIHPDDQSAVLEGLQRLSMTGRFEAEYRIVRPDGHQRWVRDRSRFVRDEGGTPIRLDGVVSDVTDQHLADEKLRASETRYRELFMANPQPMWVYDCETLQFLAVNEAAVIQYGYSREEFLSMSIRNIRPTEDVPLLMENLSRETTGIETAGVWRHKRSNGQIIHVEITSHTITFDGKRGKLVLALDVTERLKLQQQAANERDVLELLASGASMDDVLQRVALNSEQLFSGMMCSVLLLDEGGQHLRHAAAPKLPLDYCRAIDGVRIGPNTGSCGTAVYTRECVFVEDISTDPLWREYRDLALTHNLRACWSVPMISSANRVLGTLAMYYTDPRTPTIEERQAIQRVAYLAVLAVERHQLISSLRNSRQQMETLVSNLPGMAYRCQFESDWTMTYVSAGCEMVTGHQPEELIENTAKSYAGLVHTDDRDALQVQRKSSFEAGIACRHVYRIIEKSGNVRWVLDCASGVYAEDGSITFIDGFIQDVTESRQVEEQVRTSLREKDAMLKEIHHRVKNNLQIVSSLLSLQLENVNDPRTFDALRESQNRVRSMALVHETLYRSGNLGRIDLAVYVSALCAHLFRAYGIDASRIQLSLNVFNASLDLERAVPLGLITNELVSNALKYAFPDGRSGSIRVDFAVDSNHTYQLSIADDGIGLPEPFDLNQLKSLGLQLTRDLIQQLSGSLKIVYAPGTEFRISFPLLPSNDGGLL